MYSKVIAKFIRGYGYLQYCCGRYKMMKLVKRELRRTRQQ